MKKILSILAFLAILSPFKAVNSDTVYKDVKSLYKEDLKSVVAYAADKGEQGVTYLFTKADTILTKASEAFTKGSIHTYEVLKTQQIVKSYHHLFYFLLGIVMTFILYRRIKAYINDNTSENGGILVFTIIAYILLFMYNAMNFNEMLTGFINPEYGAIKEIIQFMNQYK